MPAISKHMFESACRDLDCGYLMHPWNEHCWRSIPETYKNSLIGSAKFYAIVYLVSIIWVFQYLNNYTRTFKLKCPWHDSPTSEWMYESWVVEGSLVGEMSRWRDQVVTPGSHDPSHRNRRSSMPGSPPMEKTSLLSSAVWADELRFCLASYP